jgi:TCP-1/cpn60 chaperonin family/CHAT domain
VKREFFLRSNKLLRDTGSMARGAGLVADVVKPTLGPQENLITTTIPSSHPIKTKRDFFLSETIALPDQFEALGAEIMRAAANKTNQDSGDGATITAVLAQAILERSRQAIESGLDPVELQRGIEMAVKAVLRDIKQHAEKKPTLDMCTNIARTSADGDADIAYIVRQTLGGKLKPGAVVLEGSVTRKPFIKVGSFRTGHKIKFGAYTKAEVEDCKFRIQSSLRAAQAAADEGVVAGGGAALLHASHALDRLKPANKDQIAGVGIICQALQEPIRQLVENVHVNGTSVVDSLLRERDIRTGYDAESRSYTNMMGAGIVDSAKTMGTALTNATSVASAFSTAPAGLVAGLKLTASQRHNPYFQKIISTYTPESQMGRRITASVSASQPPVSYTADTTGDAAAKTTQSGNDGLGLIDTSASEQPLRYLVGKCPDRVAKGQFATLSVFISITDAHEHASALKNLKVPAEGLTLEVAVDAKGIELKGSRRKEIFLPPNGDSTKAEFAFKAADLGEKIIRVSAFNGGTPLGGLDISITVCKAGEETAAAEQETRDPMGRVVADPYLVTLVVEYDKAQKEYSFQWQDNEGSQPSIPADSSLTPIDTAIEDTISKVQEIIRGDYATPPNLVAESLKNWGVNLWKVLIPEKIRTRFIDRYQKGKIKRLEIISNGDPYPWEMLYPFQAKPNFEKGFLIDLVELSRWRFGSRPPASIPLLRADFVISKNLPDAESEASSITVLLKHWCATLADDRIDDTEKLYELLKAGSVSLLHFACHNAVEGSSGRIIVDSLPLTPEGFSSYEGKLRATAPFIFMNACRSDAKKPKYTRINGWADSFLSMGVGIFVGTLWEVRDKTARKFAEVLYQKLVEGKPFGQALHLAREDIRKQAPSDPTWLAYSFYGAPGAHLQRN